jgi:Sec-independent protein secretion pathway component TatC
MDTTNLLWFVGLTGALAVFGLVLGALIVPPDPFSQLFVGVQWLALSIVLAYLVVLHGEEGPPLVGGE